MKFLVAGLIFRIGTLQCFVALILKVGTNQCFTAIDVESWYGDVLCSS